MSLIDKVIAAATPRESDEGRMEARAKARAAAQPGSWFEAILDHHLGIESAFVAVSEAGSAPARRAAQRALATLLTGHSNAEEAVIYPALALHDQKGPAEMSYQEQSAAKIEMAALDDLDPMSTDYVDKLEHIRGAVAHHVYEEEGSRFLRLHTDLSPEKQLTLTRRYAEEYERYGGAGRGADSEATLGAPMTAQGTQASVSSSSV